MELLFGVSNFGKIKHAEVMLGDFTLFVGDNNSGKTFMMQLLYGVLKELCKINPVLTGIEEQGENELTYGAEWLTNVEAQINDYLSENKMKIIRGIFHKDIEIGELYFHVINSNESYVCEIDEREVDEISREKEDVVTKVSRTRVSIYSTDVNADSRKRKSGIVFMQHPDREDLKKVLASQIWQMILVMGNADLLFLPASRTGLQLLSKYFFAERDRKAVGQISIFDFVDEEDETRMK